MSIDLRTMDAAELAASNHGAALMHADPPWKYGSGKVNGGASKHYETLHTGNIAAHLEAACSGAQRDAYLAVWCTFPLLQEWFAHTEQGWPWSYVTGGCWGKLGNKDGVGFHFRGDAEPLLLYRRGKPKPKRSESNLWLADRTPTHSEKPQRALETLCRLVPPGALVLDLYAGESASMALACHRTGRAYLGAEKDPERAARARMRLNQGDLFGGYPG